MLRTEIQKIIAKSENDKLAAFKILYFLEDKVGLEGNGWFDDDPEMLSFLEKADVG